MRLLKKKNILVLCLLSAVVIFLVGISFIFNKPDSAKAETEISNLTFSLNEEGTGYKVKAKNRQIQVANIPAYYENLPVTEIENNAFLSCIELQNVIIPLTVTRIGNNAFMNCKKLIHVRGFSNVIEIGNYASMEKTL